MRLTKAQKAARQFEKAIHKYLEQGDTPREAVNKAYKDYPVMKIMQNEIQSNLATTMIKASAGVITLNEARRASRMAWAKDDLTLSERTTKGGEMVQAMTAKAIQDAIKQGKRLKDLSLDIFNGYTVGGVIPTQDIPKCMAELIAIAKLKKDTDSKLYRLALSKVRNHLKRVNKPGMKAAYKQLVKAIDSLDEAKINKAIRVAAYEKTRYFAERIARTETSRAWNSGVFRRWSEDTDCVAFQWKLSTAHPVTDICDLYAHADLYGMGPGIFPKEKVPVLPAHPNCMCRLRPVMTGSELLQTEHAEDRVNKGGTDYLKKASAETRKKILGVKGATSFEYGQLTDWRTSARGYNEEYMTGSIVEGINTLEDKMKYNLAPPSDEFIAKLTKEQNQPYTIGVEKDGEKRFYSDDGKPIWPPNNGGIGHPELILLKKGQEILTRYGKTKGRYVSPLGTTLEERAMPNSTDLAQYHEYEVIRDIDSVEKSTIAPWFGKRGLGIQYRLPCSVETLLQTGKIKEVKT